ncbi:hypothetical protein WNZ15_14110 [Roseibium sp. AS2]|uniref:hypothetical protein n=1 Tax=Roseibium sp. AS2 TaxID=3135781 RepID=UPI0031789967
MYHRIPPREVFEDIVKEEKHLMADEFRLVTVEEYGQSTQKIMFYATADSPTEAWMMNVRLCEKMGDWVRRNRPQWWPRLRLAVPGDTGSSDPDGAETPVAGV